MQRCYVIDSIPTVSHGVSQALGTHETIKSSVSGVNTDKIRTKTVRITITMMILIKMMMIMMLITTAIIMIVIMMIKLTILKMINNKNNNMIACWLMMS